MDNTYSLTQHAELLKAILRNNELSICQYLTKEDALVIYDRSLAVRQVLPGYLRHLEERAAIHPEDRWKVQEFFQGKIHGEMEVRLQRKTGPAKMLVQILSIKDMEPAVCIPVAIRDVTQEKHRGGGAGGSGQEGLPDHALQSSFWERAYWRISEK